MILKFSLKNIRRTKTQKASAWCQFIFTFWCSIYSPFFCRYSDFFEKASLKYATAQEQNVSFHSWKMYSLTSLVHSSWSIGLFILSDRMGLSLGWSCFSRHLLDVLEVVLTVFWLSQVATCEIENGFLSWFYSQRWRQMADWVYILGCEVPLPSLLISRHIKMLN